MKKYKNLTQARQDIHQTKLEIRKEIEVAKKKFKKPITKLDELANLSEDYTDFSMRCAESGICESEPEWWLHQDEL